MSEKKTIGKKRKHDEYCEEESDNMEISIRKKSDTRNRKKAKKSAPLADAAEDFALPDAAEDFAPLDDAAEDFAPLDDAAEDFAPLDDAAEDNALPAAAEDFALPDAAAEDFALPDADAAEDFAPPAAAAAPIGSIRDNVALIVTIHNNEILMFLSCCRPDKCGEESHKGMCRICWIPDPRNGARGTFEGGHGAVWHELALLGKSQEFCCPVEEGGKCELE